MFDLYKLSFLAKIAMVAMSFAVFEFKSALADGIFIIDSTYNDPITISSSDTHNELIIVDNGYADNVSVKNDGSVLIDGNNAGAGTINVEDSGELQIKNGNAGTVYVYDGGYISTYEDGNINNRYIGMLTVEKNGKYTLSTKSIVGSADVSSANNSIHGSINDHGLAYQMLVNRSSELYVESGGTADETVVDGGILYVESGGTAVRTTVEEGGIINATESGATIDGITLEDGSIFNFTTDITADNIKYGSSSETSSAKIQDENAYDMQITDGSILTVVNGGTSRNASVNSGGKLIVDNGTAHEGTVSSGGTIEATSTNATVTDVKIEEGGSFIFSTDANISATYANQDLNISGGKVENLTIYGESKLSVEDNGEANNITVDGGSLVVSGGTASHTTVQDGGKLIVSSGRAEVTTITDGGSVDVGSGAILSSAVIEEGASITTSLGAILENINALSGAILDLWDGSVLSGYLQVDANTQISGDFSSTYNSSLTSLRFTNGFNDFFNNKVVNIDTSVDKDLELVDGDYTISNTVESGTALVSGWNKIILSNATVRLESDIDLAGSDKEFIINSGSTIDASGSTGNGVSVSLDGNLLNSGTIDFTTQGDSVSDNFTINGNYYGGSGSLIKMNIDPSTNTADKITITGNVSGNTGLYLQSLSARAPNGSILLVNAPSNTTGDASSFYIWRVDGSPFDWDILFDGSQWFGYVANQDTPSIVPEVAAYYGLIDNTFMQTASLGATLRKNIAESELRKVACQTTKKLKYNNRICRSNLPVFTGWVAPVYSSSEVQMPYNYTASIAGFDGGLDLFSNKTTKFGLLASYREGNYNYEQNGSNYIIDGQAETTINSYLAGLYMRHDGPTWSIVSAIYGGSFEGNTTTDDGVSSDISGTTFGATLDVNYIWYNVRDVRIEPGVRISYTSVELDEIVDNAGKNREFDNASRNEIEAGIRFVKRWVYPEAKAELFFKPSIIQTINNDSQFELIEERTLDSTEDLTLTKIEAGMSFDMIDNWSASLAGSYSFGSNYQNTTANLSLIYNF